MDCWDDGQYRRDHEDQGGGGNGGLHSVIVVMYCYGLAFAAMVCQGLWRRRKAAVAAASEGIRTGIDRHLVTQTCVLAGTTYAERQHICILSVIRHSHPRGCCEELTEEFVDTPF